MATAPTRVGYSHTASGTTSPSSVVVNPDATIANGDWMVTVVMMSSSTTTITPPIGWTILQPITSAGTLRTAIFGKIRAAADGSYSFELDSGGVSGGAAIYWGRGGGAVSTWIIGANSLRSSSQVNVAATTTTTVNNSLVLAFSTERTTTTETGVTSISGATEWMFGAQGPHLETISASYIADKNPAGATGNITITYPNVQSSNGMARQIIIPPSTTVAPNDPVTMTRWDGITEIPLSNKLWNGTSEIVIASVQMYVGQGQGLAVRLMDPDPITVAHRGGTANWPEMTMRAYSESALIFPTDALEISVHRTSDGQFVCSHDANTSRVTGIANDIALSTWAQLNGLTVTADNTDNPSQPREAFCLLSTVLAKYGGKRIIFIEDKSYQNNAALIDIINANGGTDWYVWKQAGSGGAATAASTAGYKTWGYFFDSDLSSFDAKQGQWTYVGVDYKSSDATLANQIAKAGPSRVIAHIIPSIAQRDRLLEYGIRGLMISNVRDCVGKPLKTVA